MLQLGKMHTLHVVKKTESGTYLNESNAKEKDTVLLPNAPRGLEIGDEIEVFVYNNSTGKTIASLKKPKITIGELAQLKVVGTTKFGAFLDWGMDKDLLLPAKEQLGKVTRGDTYLVGLYLDNNDKICATMYITKLLSSDTTYKPNDRVKGTVYSINQEMGAFVAVDNKYHGMIPNKELYSHLTVGENVEARVKKVKEDGKLELTLRKESHNEIEGDALKILDRLKSSSGTLMLNDNSSPEQVKSELNMSKGAFKRAVGRLLKEGAIKITASGIEKLW